MNHVFLSGNLVRDPEVRYLDGGKAVTNFTIAINERGKDGKEYTSFIRCAAWGELGIRVGDSARKGTRLSLTGKLSQKTWTDKDSKKHDDVSVVVMSADVVVKTTPPTTPPPEDDDLGDIPF
jgi:single-strand DNA-binding protein